MTDTSPTDRAEFLSQMAPNPSVSAAVLAGEESKFATARLVGDPPVSYLADSEAPAYILTNKKRGIAVGGKQNQTKPDSDRGTVAMVTGRRTLCIVGTSPEDKALEIPHSDVASVSVHTGLLAKRLEIRTPARVYHCWVGRSTATSLLDDVAAYIDDRAGADPEDLTPDTDGTEVTYRGKVIDPSPGADAVPQNEASTDGGATAQSADSDPDPTPADGGVEGAACPNCDRQFEEDVNFCPSCGEDVSALDFDSVRGREERSDSDSSDTVMYRGREVDSSYLQ